MPPTDTDRTLSGYLRKLSATAGGIETLFSTCDDLYGQMSFTGELMDINAGNSDAQLACELDSQSHFQKTGFHFRSQSAITSFIPLIDKVI